MQHIRLKSIVTFVFLILLMAAATSAFAQDSVHVVQPGENLFRIAQRYGVDVTSIAQVNNITNTWRIYSGQSLVIPGLAAAPAAEVSAPPVEVASAPLYHTVRRGEFLASIARLYNLTPGELAQMNNITNPNLIYAGQQLVVGSSAANVIPEVIPVEAPPVYEAAPAIPAPSNASYTVQPGEHLAQIAQRYGVSWLAIAQANNIYNPNHVEAGQQLIIPLNVNSADYMVASVQAAPAPAIGSGKEIIVDLSDSRVYAYENGVLVRNVLVSTGLPATPTVQGDFTVNRKYAAQTMTGPGYYLPNVPYVLYFYAGYALHGTYWHENWGQPMSHGCVNMPTPEAEWIYYWADMGTPVRVQA
jgi:LysM repeat protein